jgi:hypothetical protein
LTGAIVRRRPSKTRWPQAQEGQNHVGGLRGARAWRSRRDEEGNVGESGSAASSEAR